MSKVNSDFANEFRSVEPPVSKTDSNDGDNAVGSVAGPPPPASVTDTTVASVAVPSPPALVTTLTLYQRMRVGVSKKKPVNFEAQGEAVAEEKRINTPKNTISAYEPKGIEFHGFCVSLYGDCPSAELVTPEKVFGFLYYQAHRPKYIVKRKSGYFDREDYDKVIAKVGKHKIEYDVVGYQVIQQYLGAIRNIHAVQKRIGLVKTESSCLMSDRLKALVKLVGHRKEKVMVALYKERLDGEFQPFTLVDKIPSIEDEMWQVSALKKAGNWSDYQELLYTVYGYGNIE